MQEIVFAFEKFPKFALDKRVIALSTTLHPVSPVHATKKKHGSELQGAPLSTFKNRTWNFGGWDPREQVYVKPSWAFLERVRYKFPW